MKKIAFALQVFTLITMFPLYVVIEMNHGTVTITENNSLTEGNGNVKIIPTSYHSMHGSKMKV